MAINDPTTLTVNDVVTPIVQQAVSTLTADVQGRLSALEQQLADAAAKEAPVLLSAATGEITRFVEDKRFFWIPVGAMVFLGLVGLILVWAWVFDGNTRALDILKPVGAAFLVLIPAGVAAAQRLLQAPPTTTKGPA